MLSSSPQPSTLWQAIERVDNYRVDPPSEHLLKFLIKTPSGEDRIIGWIREPLIPVLQTSPASDVFVLIPATGTTSEPPTTSGASPLSSKFTSVRFVDSLDTPEKRSEAVAKVCQWWRDCGLFEETIGPKKWRDELYPVYYDPFRRSVGNSSTELAFTIERTCCALFGLVTYGVHMTMYLQSEQKIWVPKRSKTKQTWPGYLDNTVAGGIPYGYSPTEALIKECMEEASLPDDFVKKHLQAVGAVSYFYQAQSGWLQPEVQYCYDLIVPEGVEAPTPKPTDGEVESFELHSLDEVKELISKNVIKPNCILVLIDFMIRKGFITPESESNYLDITTRMHGLLGFK